MEDSEAEIPYSGTRTVGSATIRWEPTSFSSKNSRKSVLEMVEKALDAGILILAGWYPDLRPEVLIIWSKRTGSGSHRLDLEYSVCLTVKDDPFLYRYRLTGKPSAEPETVNFKFLDETDPIVLSRHHDQCAQ